MLEFQNIKSDSQILKGWWLVYIIHYGTWNLKQKKKKTKTKQKQKLDY